MHLKDSKFEASWLFDRLGWVTLRVVPENTGYLIRAHISCGEFYENFVFDTHTNEKDARLHVARLSPQDVYDVCANYTGLNSCQKIA